MIGLAIRNTYECHMTHRLQWVQPMRDKRYLSSWYDINEPRFFVCSVPSICGRGFDVGRSSVSAPGLLPRARPRSMYPGIHGSGPQLIIYAPKPHLYRKWYLPRQLSPRIDYIWPMTTHAPDQCIRCMPAAGSCRSLRAASINQIHCSHRLRLSRGVF